MRLNVDCQIGRSPSLTCCGGAIVPRRHKGEAETPVVPSLSVGCSLASQGRRTTTRHCLLGGLMLQVRVIGGGRALDVPWAKGSRVVSCGHRSSQPSEALRHLHTRCLTCCLYIHTRCLSVSHTSLFTLHATPTRNAVNIPPPRPSIAIPYRFRYSCLPSSTLYPASSPTCHSPDPRSMT